LAEGHKVGVNDISKKYKHEYDDRWLEENAEGIAAWLASLEKGNSSSADTTSDGPETGTGPATTPAERRSQGHTVNVGPKMKLKQANKMWAAMNEQVCFYIIWASLACTDNS
jgi:hypothetical protein